MRSEGSAKRSLTLSTVGLAGLAVLAGCGDARPHTDLMADAAADVEAIRLEQAMVRYDSARTKAPEDAEAHRQYAKLASYFSLHAEAALAWERVLELEPGDSAAWEGYIHDLRWAGIFETDRRYAEKILQVLPEALRHAPDRPVIYDEAQEAAADLGQLDAYGAVLAEVEASRPDSHILLHALGALRIALAEQEEGDRAEAVRDSIGTVLDALRRRDRGRSGRRGAGPVPARGGIRLPHASSGRRRGPLAGTPGGRPGPRRPGGRPAVLGPGHRMAGRPLRGWRG